MGYVRLQTNVEYLLMVAIAVLIVLVAAIAFFRVTDVMIEEYNGLLGFEENLIGVIVG